MTREADERVGQDAPAETVSGPRLLGTGVNVVSTSPSGTEILYALGVEPVAVSHRCDHPPAVRELPRIDASRISGGDSADRHRQVREAAAGDGVYDVDAATLRDVEPDLIVTQSVCGVCAVDEALVDSVLADLDVDPDVLGLEASTLSDCFECIRAVGEATGRAERADALVADLRERLEEVEEAVADAADRRRPSVAAVEWMDPIHLAANWVPELVDVAGGEYGLVEAGAGSSEVAWETLREYDPEVLVVAPCGVSAEATRERVDELAGREGWGELTAVREGQVYALDGSAYLNRWTPRLVDAAERLASIVHPEAVGPPPEDVLRLETPTRA